MDEANDSGLQSLDSGLLFHWGYLRCLSAPWGFMKSSPTEQAGGGATSNIFRPRGLYPLANGLEAHGLVALGALHGNRLNRSLKSR